MCNNLILFITTSSGHHNQPQSSITTYGCHHILPSTQMFPQLYVSNRHSVHGTLYTSKVNSFLEKIPRKDLWVWVSTEMCSHYWVTPPFDFITAHCITPYICPYYSSHNIHSICLCNCICTVQIVLVWVLVSNFIIQPTDFQPTFVHITLLRLHSICICTCICICLDRIHHHASKQNVSNRKKII